MAVGKIIALTRDDDAASARDRLEWTNAQRVIFVLPSDALNFKNQIDFELVRRAGVAYSCAVAVVAPDARQRLNARNAGLPTFENVEQARKNRWVPDEEYEPLKRLTPPRRFAPNSLQRFFPQKNILLTALRSLMVIATMLFVGLVALMILPSAKITLVAPSQTLQTIVPVTLDTRATRVNLTDRIVPAQRVDTFVDGTVIVPTTGKKDVPSSKARGYVTFLNILSTQYTVSRNTVVRTSGGSTALRYITLNDVTVPPGGRGDVFIEALEEGALSNVGANQVNQVEGIASVAVTVLNPAPIGGGGGRTVNAVTKDDYERAKKQLTEQLLAEANTKIRAEAIKAQGDVYVVPGSLFIAEVQNESYDRFVTEAADQLQLDMRLQVSGLAIEPTSLSQIARDALTKKLPSGYDLVEVALDRGDEAEEGSGARTEFFIIAYGKAGAAIEESNVQKLVRGKPIPEAQTTLTRTYNLKTPPSISVEPKWLNNWLNRMPYVPLRIQADIKREA